MLHRHQNALKQAGDKRIARAYKLQDDDMLQYLGIIPSSNREFSEIIAAMRVLRTKVEVMMSEDVVSKAASMKELMGASDYKIPEIQKRWDPKNHDRTIRIVHGPKNRSSPTGGNVAVEISEGARRAHAIGVAGVKAGKHEFDLVVEEGGSFDHTGGEHSAGSVWVGITRDLSAGMWTDFE